MGDVLHTKGNLAKRKITADGLCPIYKEGVETSCHVLWNCVAARDIWANSSSPLQKAKCMEGDFYLLWESLLHKYDKKELEVIASIFRRICLRRNRMVFQGICDSPNKIWHGARMEAELFVLAQDDKKDQSKGLGGRVSIVRRSPPPKN